MASASSTYQPRRPEQGALHQLVRDHFETFRAQAAHKRDDQGLPRFVEQEFRDFLTVPMNDRTTMSVRCW